MSAPMNLVLFTHPEFLGLRSQDQFARWLATAFQQRGHQVSLRRPRAFARRWPVRPGLAKWAGYVDQFLVFPRELRRELRGDPRHTLYVFCDQAVGPWVPLVAGRPHVVHCHDFLALRSALGLCPENPTGFTGRLYQRWIRAGFRHARHFISISQRTREDLHALGGVRPTTSEVVYNGLPQAFHRLQEAQADARLAEAGLAPPPAGFLLHVSGGQWYKNTAGVVRLYGAWAATVAEPAQLWLVVPEPGAALLAEVSALPPGAQVRWLRDVAAPTLEALYTRARALLFPSLAEGFGWPIAEAMACGCPVLTTGEAPMTEVGGDAARYLPRLAAPEALAAWAADGAAVLAGLLARTPEERGLDASQACHQARRFDADAAIEAILGIYRRILEHEAGRPA